MYKDKIIKKLVTKKLVETQCNSQHSNTLNQSSFSLPSNSLNENSPNTKQISLQEQQHPSIELPCSSRLQEISHSIQTHHQRPERNIAMKNIYVGNLPTPSDITKQDICELFDLNSASYVRDTCNIDFPINNKTGKFKGFAFVWAPTYIADELFILDCIAYHDNELSVEDAKSTRKKTNNNTSNES